MYEKKKRKIPIGHYYKRIWTSFYNFGKLEKCLPQTKKQFVYKTVGNII